MALLCSGLSLVGPLLWILPMLAARVIFPDIDALWPSLAVPAEASFVSLALMLLPHGMIGFVVSAILSATLGQANDAFNWLSATVTRDVYVPLQARRGRGEPSERRQLGVARATMLIVGGLGIAVALYIPRFGGAFSFALQYYSLFAAFMMPVALGILYTRTPWWSGIASCSAAIAAAVTLMALGLWEDHAFARNMISESVMATAVFFGSALWYRKDDPRNGELHRLAQDLRTPVAHREQVDPGALRVYRMLGTVCLMLGAVLVACLAVDSTEVAPAGINLVGGLMLLALGGVLYYVSRERTT